MWRLRGRGLPGPHVPLDVQVCSASGRRAGNPDHGEP